MTAWRGAKLASGKRAIVWRVQDAAPAVVDSELRLPCGQCIGCRLERSRQWAIRCVHEASLYERNSFITLTYDEGHLPLDGSLHVEDWQLFMKRLRKRAAGVRIRFFHCGEYGERVRRPHFHACLFNWDFPDRKFWSCRNGVNLFRSALLEELWPSGFSTVGDVTFESAAYVARYIMKKVTGDRALSHYVDRSTGVVLSPEYTTMSRGGRGGLGGIGKGWFDKYSLDVYPHDFVVLRGMKMRPARFYDGLYDDVDPEDFARVKARRNTRGFVLRSDNTAERLLVKEEVTKSRIKNLVRTMEV